MKKSIECWIYDTTTERFLLLQCPENDRHKAYWQPVTGGIEAGEDGLAACIREIREETGAMVEAPKIRMLLDGFRVYSNEKELHKTVFLLETPGMAVTVSDEHIGYRWACPDEVGDLLLWGSNRITFGRVLRYLGLS
ncbi:NUDIX domain-containing protein [Desulfatiferula olefinivorans]